MTSRWLFLWLATVSSSLPTIQWPETELPAVSWSNRLRSHRCFALAIVNMTAKWTILSLTLFYALLMISQKPVKCQDTDCDYFQNVVLGRTYYIFSKGFPNHYNKGLACRWQAQCPPKTHCRLRCPSIKLPNTTDCSSDRLLISKYGDSALIGAEEYCGETSLDILSTSNWISVGLITSGDSEGGSFFCTLVAQPSYIIEEDCHCGWKHKKRIVGGKETRINEFPMMVGLVDIAHKIVYCGGTIIHENWILTAAHCLYSQKASNVAVLYGDHNIKLSDSPATGLIKSRRFVIHSQYNAGYDYDIGLIKTQGKIPFSDRVGPACLPFKFSHHTFTGSVVQALGWGTQSFDGEDSDFLQKVRLDVIDKETCIQHMEDVVNERTLCTYTPGKDTCQHDSGGPLLYHEPRSGRIYVVGITIAGYSCAASKPGLNSRVTEYLKWIKSKTANVKYCNK